MTILVHDSESPYLVKSGVAPDGLGLVEVDQEDGGEDETVNTGDSHAGILTPSLNIAQDTPTTVSHILSLERNCSVKLKSKGSKSTKYPNIL